MQKPSKKWLQTNPEGLLIIYTLGLLLLFTFLGCEGWSVMGYAFDKSSDSTQVEIQETYE